MKYPAKQLELLEKGILAISRHMDVSAMYPSNLHYLVYQQSSDGQPHNWIYVSPEGSIARAHKIEDLTGWTKLVELPNTFELYPDNCHDSHVETAVKFCLKKLAQ